MMIKFFLPSLLTEKSDLETSFHSWNLYVLLPQFRFSPFDFVVLNLNIIHEMQAVFWVPLLRFYSNMKIQYVDCRIEFWGEIVRGKAYVSHPVESKVLNSLISTIKQNWLA